MVCCGEDMNLNVWALCPLSSICDYLHKSFACSYRDHLHVLPVDNLRIAV